MHQKSTKKSLIDDLSKRLLELVKSHDKIEVFKMVIKKIRHEKQSKIKPIKTGKEIGNVLFWL